MTSRLATVAAGLSAGQFGIVCGMDGPDAGSSGYSSSLFTQGSQLGESMEFTMRGVYDLRRRRFIIACGGHTSDGSNIHLAPFLFAAYQIDTNTIIDKGSTNPNLDANHAYCMCALDISRDRWYRWRVNTGEMWSCNIDKDWSSITSGDWSHPSPEINDIPGLSLNRGGTCYFPERNSLVTLNAPGFTGLQEWRVNTTETTWHLLGGGASFNSQWEGVIMVPNPVKKCLIFGGGADTNSLPITYHKEIWAMFADGTITRMDDCPLNIYSSDNTKVFTDPINGRTYFASYANYDANNVAITTGPVACYSLDISASPGSQWRVETAIGANWPQFGDAANSSMIGVVTAEAWDQGVVLFATFRNLWALKISNNNRAGHETQSGSLSNADLATLPGFMWSFPCDDQSQLKPQWDGTDAGLNSVMAAAGYSSNYSLNYLSTGANCFARRQPHVSNTFTIPTIVADSGDTWLNLPITRKCGENGAYAVFPLNGSWPAVESQRFYISPASPNGRVVWMRFSWKPDQAYWTSFWRKVGLNYQDGLAIATAGSNVISWPAATNRPFDVGNWPIGRDIAILDAGNTSDLGIFQVLSVVDSTHIQVSHVFNANYSGLAAAISGLGDGPGGLGFCVDSFKILIFDDTPPFENNPAGSAVFLNSRINGGNALTQSPNAYAYSNQIFLQANENNGTVPFSQTGENVIVIRQELLETTFSPTGAPFTNRRITWWNNGVGGGDFIQTDWQTAPSLYGSDDSTGKPWGLSMVQVTMQHSYGDPTQDQGVVMNYLFKDFITSTGPIPLGGIITVPTVPIPKSTAPFLFKRG